MDNANKKRRNDILLLAGILIIGVISFFIINSMNADGALVEVIVDGKVMESFPLDKEREVELHYNGYNLLMIKDGYASIENADCPDKLCMDQRRINKDGETIVCLPHKLIIKISGGDDAQVDGVV